MRLDPVIFRVGDALGYCLCELAFRTDCRSPFALAYRAGCWFYGKAGEAGIRCGALIENPAFGTEEGQPMYVEVRSSHP